MGIVFKFIHAKSKSKTVKIKLQCPTTTDSTNGKLETLVVE